MWLERYRQVIPNQVIPPVWKEFIVNTGATLSTLQDIKVADAGGGYTYVSKNKDFTRNRFIYWRINQEFLELVEHSLDVDLEGNHLRLRFKDTALLDGVSIHETDNSIIILVPTIGSVHRFVLPHPKNQHVEGSTIHKSIFSDFTVPVGPKWSNSSHVFTSSVAPNVSANMVLPHCAASWLSSSHEAYFAVGSNNGVILFVKMPKHDLQGAIIARELKQSSVMKRLWTGVLPTSMQRNTDAACSPASIFINSWKNIPYVFAFCRDYKLRLWSTKDDFECVMTADIGKTNGSVQTYSGSSSIGKFKVVQNTEGNCEFACYMTTGDQSSVICYTLVKCNGQIGLLKLDTRPVQNGHLIDFVVDTNKLWTLTSDSSQAETQLKFYDLDTDNHLAEWINVPLEPVLTSVTDTPSTIENEMETTSEMFMREIFFPGRFTFDTITQTLRISRKSSIHTPGTNSTPDFDKLQAEVLTAVENEIIHRLVQLGCDNDEEAYAEVSAAAWSKFYSGCVQLQYRAANIKPLSLIVNSETDFVCLVLKSSYSLIRPADDVECLYYGVKYNQGLQELQYKSPFNGNVNLYDATISLFKGIHLVEANLSDRYRNMVYQELHSLNEPSFICEELSTIILANDAGLEGAFAISLKNWLTQDAEHVNMGLHLLLEVMTLGDLNCLDDSDASVSSTTSAQRLFCNELFAGSLGANVLYESAVKCIEMRFNVVLCAFVLMQSSLEISKTNQGLISVDTRNALEKELVPRFSDLLRDYYIMMWMSRTIARPVARSIFDSGLKQLKALNLSDDTVKSAISVSARPISVLEVFIRSESSARKLRGFLSTSDLFDCENEDYMDWHEALLNLMKIVCRFACPRTTDFTEFLFSNCQYSTLQKYSRLLDTWCEVHLYLRKFLVAQSYLWMGNFNQAVVLFMEINPLLLANEPLFKRILNIADAEVIPSKYVFAYYQKVICSLEEFGLPQHALNISEVALAVAEQQSMETIAFWALLFKHHLQMEHYDQAYDAMIAIPNPERQRDCLRQLVVTLSEPSKHAILVAFPFLGLEEDVTNIIDARAKAVDLHKQSYYELLFAFFMKRNNYRKAGTVMYEYAMRLGQESFGLHILQKQAKCYLACLNCFRMLDPANRWLVKPVYQKSTRSRTSTSIDDDDMIAASPKRNSTGEEILQQGSKSLIVLELCDIKKEYELIRAKLQLFKRGQVVEDLLGPTMTAEELVVYLVNNDLYRAAIDLCKLFELPEDSWLTVFDTMTSRVLQVTKGICRVNNQSDELLEKELWDWIHENDRSSMQFSAKCSITQSAWNLLQKFLSECEKTGKTLLHKSITNRILSSNMTIPTWLASSYKKRNVSEFVLLYLRYDKLIEAAELFIAYIDALLGIQYESFGMKTCLSANSPPVLMPYFVLDCLFQKLELLKSSNQNFVKLHTELNTRLKSYQTKLEQVSDQVANKQRQTHG